MVIKSPGHTRCNKCGQTINQYEGFFSLNNYTMPYGSQHDSDILDLTLCISCLDEFVGKCAVNPIKTDEAENFLKIVQ